MFCRVLVTRCAVKVQPTGSASQKLKDAVKQHGVWVALYYWVANELVVGILTYLLHYGYFGKEDLVSALEKVGASKYVNFDAVETKSWSCFNRRLEFSARLIANFMAASVFMSLFTPLKIPLAIATYPAFRRTLRRFNFTSTKPIKPATAQSVS